MTSDPTAVTELDELMTAIRGYDDPRRAAGEWKKVYRLLQKTDLPAGRVTGVVGMRDLAGLAELIDRLRDPEASAGPADADEPDPEICKRALRAFRKRLALTRLDEESKLGRGPLSKGSDPSRAAITPPTEWPDAVWQALTRQGKLRSIGHGLYELDKP
ncbi:MAG TPA: hypothetical protein VM031_00300 [Phycisphaerae bacterium]|nr:hypothetical protein [Phycisphaerae bacterium]